LPTFTAREPTLPNNERFEHGRWLTLGQACRMLNVDESTLRRWADAGQVRTFRITSLDPSSKKIELELT